MKISVVIPTFNEEGQISRTIRSLKQNSGSERLEIIVSDGGSSDRTLEMAENAGAFTCVSPKRGRSSQMNFGATKATGSIIYFLHADTFPPKNFLAAIQQAIQEGHKCGCFALSFDHPHWFLKASCWFTYLETTYIRYGDQSLFVDRDIFWKCGGFNDHLKLFEDQEIVRRLKKLSSFKVIKQPVLTSARKYLQNGIYRTQLIYLLLFVLYLSGVHQKALLNLYKKFLK